MARSRIRTGLFILFGICLFTGAVAVNTAGGPPAQLDDANVSVTQSPGTQFTGAVATEGVALENELHRRTVRISLARARTPDMKATVITENEAAFDTQLDSLEARSARLVYALRTGRIEQDRYRAEAAVIDAEARGIEHRIDLLRGAATRLSDDRLEAHGTSLDALAQLEERARTVGADDDDRDIDTADDDSSDDSSTDDDDTGDDDRNDDDSGDDAGRMPRPIPGGHG